MTQSANLLHDFYRSSQNRADLDLEISKSKQAGIDAAFIEAKQAGDALSSRQKAASECSFAEEIASLFLSVGSMTTGSLLISNGQFVTGSLTCASGALALGGQLLCASGLAPNIGRALRLGAGACGLGTGLFYGKDILFGQGVLSKKESLEMAVQGLFSLLQGTSQAISAMGRGDLAKAQRDHFIASGRAERLSTELSIHREKTLLEHELHMISTSFFMLHSKLARIGREICEKLHSEITG